MILLLVGQGWSSCEPETAARQFGKKGLLNESVPAANPYLRKDDPEFVELVNRTLSDPSLFCVVKYLDSTRSGYVLKQSQALEEDLAQGWLVTHRGRCGQCSTLQDLAVYLARDLTAPVRECGLRHFYSEGATLECIRRLGFSEGCARVWLYNTLNTKRECLRPCLWSTLTREPNVRNGSLNPCLQCDEDKSGPFFKFASGRTRRNSGIHSEIDRPQDEIYEMAQCYY
jgi:hypothetical protein